MPEISAAAISSLIEQLQAATGRGKSRLRAEFAATHGCSMSTLSRRLSEAGLRSHERSDRGKRRLQVDDEQLAQVAAIQATSMSLRKGVVMPAKDAIEIAAKNGIAPNVSASFLNGWLRQRQGTRRDATQATPHIELRSLGPNHVHQVDFSLAVNWKVKNNLPIYEHLVYKNKLPASGEPRIWRLIVVDHATGCFFVNYTVSAGETVQALLEGLYRAWAEKQVRGKSITKQFPFRGVPRILMADRGSAMQAGVTAQTCNRLGVHLHICEGARSKGTVETSHRWWEEHFESRLRLQPPQSVEQLNEWATEFAALYCATERHSRHNSERSTLWVWHIGRKPETQLRELRCDFETFKGIALSESQRCRVGGSRIVRFRSQKYRVPEQVPANSWVNVQYSPFEFPQVQITAEGSSQTWLCSPVALDEFGFAADAATIGTEYKSQKHSTAQTFAREAAAGAKEIAGKLQAFGYHLERTPEVGVPSIGEEVQVAAQANTAGMTKVAARHLLIELLGRTLTPPEAEYIGTFFGELVTEDRVYEAVDAIQRGIRGRVVSFPAAQGGKL